MIPGRVSIYVATEPLDLRRSFDGLAAVVREVLRQDPLSGALFLFFNREADRCKALWWDRSGVFRYQNPGTLRYRRTSRCSRRVATTGSST
ncbi:IS66 family insertion sequence element accessory protein TnpB [Sorangium sp. So ce269]